MRIPLDYYRILGIPLQVTDEQINQAHYDRSLQLPRREYSELAINARRQLLDEAFEVLSDPDRRATYDAQFFEKLYDLDSPPEIEVPSEPVEASTPAIEIYPEQLVGALLILQDLGEYELVIHLGEPSLSPETAKIPQKARADVILTLALAYLELSREQWQQRDYEKAADLARKGLELLKSENLFPSVQEDIQGDFYKLRPYRILELLAQGEDKVAERAKGLQLLRAMLQERHGIDGKGNDRSGLSIDDFLRFIQQLRIHLTVEEQHKLFEVEAHRPSAVATYLKVYALIARGFAQRQPALMVEAKDILNRLSKRQDVYLEQAVCSLLLGQTEAAASAVERSQEAETLAFIQEQSQGSPDLLPGLCLYGERWLQAEVFSHFRDLVNQKASLKDYFANEAVQAYLEQLPLENEVAALATLKTEAIAGKVAQERATGMARNSVFARSHAAGRPEVLKVGNGGTVTFSPPSPSRVRGDRASFNSPKRSRRQVSETGAAPRHRQQLADSPTEIQESPALPIPTRKKSLRRKKSPKIKPLLLGICLLFGLGALGFGLKTLLMSLSPIPQLEGENLFIQLDRPPIEIPPADAQVILPEGELTKESAELTIQSWLSSKAQAFGPEHQIDQLNTILTGPVLSTWRDRAGQLKGTDNYRKYDHQIQVKSVKISTKNPNKASIEARIREKTDYYENGKLNKSNDDKLLVRYDLVRQNNQWLIKNIEAR